jgi:hypothetical protein
MKPFFICLILFFTLQQIQAQSEVGITEGGTLFKGDVNTKYALKETRLGGGIFYRYNFKGGHFAVRSNANSLSVQGSDARDASTDPKEINLKFRNLSFRTQIFEVNVLTEYYFLSFTKYKWSPYVFLGAGYLKFNPQTKYQGQWVDLQPLHTENVDYKLHAFTPIVGFGAVYKISAHFKVGFEIGFRKTTTDYLDDVSTVYADKYQLQQNYGSLSAALSDRSGEWYGDPTMANYVNRYGGFISDPYSPTGYRINGYGKAGDQRGYSSMDNYIVYNFSVSYVFGRKNN